MLHHFDPLVEICERLDKDIELNVAFLRRMADQFETKRFLLPAHDTDPVLVFLHARHVKASFRYSAWGATGITAFVVRDLQIGAVENQVAHAPRFTEMAALGHIAFARCGFKLLPTRRRQFGVGHTQNIHLSALLSEISERGF